MARFSSRSGTWSPVDHVKYTWLHGAWNPKKKTHTHTQGTRLNITQVTSKIDFSKTILKGGNQFLKGVPKKTWEKKTTNLLVFISPNLKPGKLSPRSVTFEDERREGGKPHQFLALRNRGYRYLVPFCQINLRWHYNPDESSLCQDFPGLWNTIISSLTRSVYQL